MIFTNRSLKGRRCRRRIKVRIVGDHGDVMDSENLSAHVVEVPAQTAEATGSLNNHGRVGKLTPCGAATRNMSRFC